jgi:hypothetical protein
VGAQEFARLVEQVGQLGGLLLEPGKIDGGHGFTVIARSVGCDEAISE